MFPKPPPTPRRGFVAGIVIGLVIAGLSAAVVYLLATRESGSAASPPPSATTSKPGVSPSVSPSPTPTRPPAQVSEAFDLQDWAEGERVLLGIVDLGVADHGCAVHSYRVRGATHEAYETDCPSWEKDGYDIILFQVTLRNATKTAIPFNLRNFVLTARDGRTFGPVNVRSKAEFPPNFTYAT